MISTDNDLRLADLVGTDHDPAPPAAAEPAPAPGGLVLSGQQAEAADKIKAWYADDSDTAQVFRLFGYAGTGKTSTARSIVDQLQLRTVHYAAFTGKAAYVLRQRGCFGASTVHSLIYQPVEKVVEELNKLRRQLRDVTDPDERAELIAEIKRQQHKADSPDWILRDASELEDTQLLVLDEVSMVGERMARDLLGYGCKILCLGDPAQLPPVDGAGYLINAVPDCLLTEIHRSALDSPVTRMATAIRNSQPGERDYGISGPDGTSGRVDRLTLADLLTFDQILVGKNATRWQAVHLLRALRGLVGPPQQGDRIIVLANSSECQVFNGQQFDVLDNRPDPTGRNDRYHLVVQDDEGNTRHLTTWASGFKDLDGEREAKRNGRGTIVAATFGQAITTHKSQGSQWPSVLVVDESSVFYGAAYREHSKVAGPEVAAIEGHVNGRRWLYTSITRAAERAVIVPSLNGVITA